MIKKIILLVLLSLISTVSNFYAQCTGCTTTNPVLSGNYTFASGSTVCFTSNATLGDVIFQNNSKICVAPGVTVIIQNNINSTSGNNVALEIGGTLQFNQVPTFNANLTANVQSGGILRSGTTGNNNFTFNGTTNTLTNNGTVQVSVLQFQNSGSTNIVENYGTLTIGSNINISGTSTTFRNSNLINIGQSFNMNSSTTYINCGTINTGTGFNVGGGKVINTSIFNASTGGSGGLDLTGNSRFENYGIVDSKGSINNNNPTCSIYNEGLFKITSYQGTGALVGPSSSTKKGYFETVNQMTINSAKVGPNLDFKRTSGASSQSTVFNSAPTYVNASGTPTTQSGANVTYDCRATTCSAPLVTNIGLCPNIDGTFPPQANDDTYTITPGSSASTNVLINDFAQYNGAAATTSNVTIAQVSTTNPGVTINSSGIVSVAAGTPAGTYTLVYRICSITNSTSCDTATVTVTVPPTIDAINGSQTVNSGSTGTSVLANDTIQNGTAGSVTLGATGNATISQTSTTNAGVNIDTATGNVVVSPGTPAGTYTITYQICTKATPVTCDTATETVTVPNLLDAVNDTYGSVTAGTTTTISVIANDKNIAGTAAVIGTGAGQVSIRTSTNAAGTAGAWPTGFTLNANGTITVATGTAAGAYTLYYTICNQTAGTPCDTAAVTLTVITTVQADDDAFAATAAQGISGATLGNVLTNDNYNGGSATTSNVNISVTTPATPAYAGAPVPSINTATGEVTLPPNTPAGSYAITYQICDKSGSPCDPATVTVTVDATVCAGNTTQLTGSGTPASTNPWVSSNTSIATVSNTGLVTALSGTSGTVNITYTNSSGSSQVVTVTVNNCCNAGSTAPIVN